MARPRRDARWAGTWFSIFPNVQTVAAQALAVSIVIGSYLAAQYARVWRPRRRGTQAARLAERPAAPLITGASSRSPA
jgi:hypothetical protein